MTSACDRYDDEPYERCGRHHPTEATFPLLPGTYLCCCGGPWMTVADMCSSGAYEGEADKVYLELLQGEVLALRADLKALTAQSNESAQQ